MHSNNLSQKYNLTFVQNDDVPGAPNALHLSGQAALYFLTHAKTLLHTAHS